MGIIAVVVIAVLSAIVAASANTATGSAATAGACQPELEPTWGVEGEPIEVLLVCGTGQLPAAGEVRLVDAPPGALLAADGRSIRWMPDLDQAATYDIGVQIGDERTSVVVGVGDAWAQPDNVAPLEPTRLTMESGLPVFHIVTDASVDADEYRPARVTHLGHEYVGAAAKLRGSLSLRYEKDNFTLRFDPNDPFTDPRLPALDGSLKLVLNGDFDDNSHLRNRVAFELWDQMSPAHLQVGHASAVVYVNGEYAGLYTVTDQIGEEFLADAGLEGGELYKSVGHDADFTSAPGTLADRDLEQKVPDPKDQVVADPAVFDLYDFVDGADDGTFRAEIADRVVLDDFVDWLVLVSLIGAGDSTAKNAYVYGPADGSGFRAIPWDFNHSFGQDFLTHRVPPDAALPSSIVDDNRLFARLLDDPVLGALVVERTDEVLGGVGSADAVDELVAQLGTEVRAAALRDEQRWASTHRETPAWSERDDFTTFDQELDQLTAWYAERIGVLRDDLRRVTKV